MGEAFISRRGVRASGFAVIGVTFPSGSTVTCTKGDTSLTPIGSGTTVYFNVPEAGTWTVSISDSTHSAVTRSVVISTQGQVEKVSIDYQLVLFDNGTGGSNWTAGADPYTGGTSSIGSTLHMVGSPGGENVGSSAGYVYSQALSLDGRSRISAVATAAFTLSALSKAGHAQIRLVREADAFYTSDPVLEVDLTEGTGQTTVVDLSNIDKTVKYKIVFFARGAYYNDYSPGGIDSFTTTVDVTNVTLT